MKLTLAKFVVLSVELGGIRLPIGFHTMYKSVAFEREYDRDSFYDLMKEEYPHHNFYKERYGPYPIIQCGNLDRN